MLNTMYTLVHTCKTTDINNIETYLYGVKGIRCRSIASRCRSIASLHHSTGGRFHQTTRLPGG